MILERLKFFKLKSYRLHNDLIKIIKRAKGIIVCYAKVHLTAEGKHTAVSFSYNIFRFKKKIDDNMADDE